MPRKARARTPEKERRKKGNSNSYEKKERERERDDDGARRNDDKNETTKTNRAPIFTRAIQTRKRVRVFVPISSSPSLCVWYEM